MSNFLDPKYEKLEAYTPGEQPQDRKYIKLNTNESPFPPSDGVIKALNEAEICALNLYPDPECLELRREIAWHYGVNPENVLVSNGSDDILSFYFMAFADANGGAVFPDITYGFYKVYSELYGVRYREIPLKEDFTIDISDYVSAGRNIVIANPNAPTGIALSLDDIEKICASNSDNTVLIDEAYVDFGAQSSTGLIKKYKNLITVMTYSKSRSMAGARLGFAIADAGIIEDFNKIKYSINPYSVNRLTARAGIAAMKDSGYYALNCAKIAEIREYTKKTLKQAGFTLTDSKSNFIFVKYNGCDGELLYASLKKRGILVRHFSKERIKDYIRITIGTREQMDALITALCDIVK